MLALTLIFNSYIGFWSFQFDVLDLIKPTCRHNKGIEVRLNKVTSDCNMNLLSFISSTPSHFLLFLLIRRHFFLISAVIFEQAFWSGMGSQRCSLLGKRVSIQLQILFDSFPIMPSKYWQWYRHTDIWSAWFGEESWRRVWYLELQRFGWCFISIQEFHW